MIIHRKNNQIAIYLIVLCGLIWLGCNLSIIGVVPSAAASQRPVNLSNTGISLKSNGKDVELNLNEEELRILRDILSNFYKGIDVVREERAFKRVISWKEDFENIARKYRNVNWKMLSAIIKAETQGKTGRQESNAKAVGISQVKYQGAWAFLWDVMFSYEIKRGSEYEKDYYNANLRVRYHSQLQQICQYLEENRIIVTPAGRSEKDYRYAKSASWTNLKAHLRKKYKPGEYQVAVDIAAMYIDHLIITFQRVNHQVVEIKEYVEGSHFDSFSEIKLSGTTRIRWNSIKSNLLKQKGESNFREITLARLNHILNSLEEPSIYSAAYNLGISKCLSYMESGMNLPKEILQYVEKVSMYHAIFTEFINNYNSSQKENVIFR